MSIKNIAIERLSRQLETLGCHFKIITEDGTEFGDLEVVREKSKREANRFVNETNYRELCKNLRPGESVFIPAGTAPLDGLQALCATYMGQTFGKGTYMTARQSERNGVEVLRLE
jgi:hypothetical protein